MKHKGIISAIILAAPGLMAADYAVTITPGSLAESLAQIPEGETVLKVSGAASISDLLAMQKVAGVKTLDLSELNIEASRLPDGDFYGRSLFAANELPAYIFAATDYESIILPGSITAIGEAAFSGCYAEKIVIPGSVTTVGAYAFSGMPRLTSVSGGEGVRTLGPGVFSNDAKATDIDLSKMQIETIPDRTFSGCVELTSVSLPASVKSVGSQAFAGSGVTDLTLSNVSVYSDYALAGMDALRSATVSSDAAQGEGIFMADRSLQTASGVSADIPAYTFAGCDALDINAILVNTRTIGDAAFAGTHATEIVMGKDLAAIGANAFHNAAALETIDVTALEGVVPAVEQTTFSGIDCPAVRLVVNYDDVDTWRAAPVWNEFDIATNAENRTPEIDNGDGIRFGLEGDVMTVVAEKPLRRVTIYDAGGSVLIDETPDAPRFSVMLQRLGGSGVVIVRAATEGSAKSGKLILR